MGSVSVTMNMTYWAGLDFKWSILFWHQSISFVLDNANSSFVSSLEISSCLFSKLHVCTHKEPLFINWSFHSMKSISYYPIYKSFSFILFSVVKELMKQVNNKKKVCPFIVWKLNNGDTQKRKLFHQRNYLTAM
jgi:hypothetical protein